MRRIVVAFALASALSAGGPSWARVGVTSATAGDPLGQPPTEQERILRVGVDVQANERVTTKADDRAHLVFLDGTSLTVGPDSTLVLDKFVYDPASKKGELNLSAAKGVFRLVGGAISKSNEIQITTPSASIGIRGGIATFEVNASGTTANFLYGRSMTVRAQGQSQTATREGSTIHVEAGQVPEQAIIISPHRHLAGNLIEKPESPDSGGPKVGGQGEGGGRLQMTEAQIGEALDKSGFAKSNSKESLTELAEASGQGGKSKVTPPKISLLKGASTVKQTIANQISKQQGRGSHH